MRIRPLSNRVLVRVDEQKTETEGGIALPDTAQEKPETGTVVAIGPGFIHPKTGVRSPMSVSVGERVMFHRLSGRHTVLDDDGLRIFDESEILAVLA